MLESKCPVSSAATHAKTASGASAVLQTEARSRQQHRGIMNAPCTPAPPEVNGARCLKEPKVAGTDGITATSS